MASINPLLISTLTLPVKLFARKHYVPEAPFDELELDPAKPILYVLETGEALDITCLQRACLAAGLPDPLATLVINETACCRYIAVNDAAGCDALFAFLLKAHEFDRKLDVQLVPVKLFWDRYPGKEGKFRKPSRMPQIIKQSWKLLIKGRENLVRFSQPVSLQYMAEHHGTDAAIAHKLARIARIHFSRQKIAATGPQLPDRDQMFEHLLASPAMQKALADEAKAKGCSNDKAKDIALSYLEEIATDFSYRAIRTADSMLGWIWNRIYKGIEVNNAEAIRRLAEEGHEIVYAPCHRSHMDYLLLSYVLYHQGMVPPHIAAGVNLNFWPAGPIFRHTGAFFIRRSFRGNKLYATVFREYLATLFSKGYAVEYFTEGGRTRTGRLLTPKTGMVSMTVQAMLRGLERPVTIVPVYFGYENVMEVATYYKELKGAKKEKESFWQVLGIFRKLRNFGRGYVNFGEPIQVDAYLDQAAPQWRNDIDPVEAQKPNWMTPVVNGLAGELMTRINGAAAVNSLALTATALLASDNNALSRSRLEQQLDLLLGLLTAVPYGDLVTVPPLSGSELLAQAIELKKFELSDDELGQVISLDPQQAILLTFYRNNIQHLFVLPSLVATILVRQPGASREQLMAQVVQLYPLLKAELFLHFDDAALTNYVGALLDFFVRSEAVDEIAGALTVTCTHTARFELLAQIIQQTLQRYACVLLLMVQKPEASRSEWEKESQTLALRLAALHGISGPELMDRKIFGGFIQELRNQGYLEPESTQKSLKALTALVSGLLDSKVEQTIREVV